jgi:hypothetical protein
VRSTSPVSDFLSDNVRSTSHSKDSERRLQAGARFNLSECKVTNLNLQFGCKTDIFLEIPKNDDV